MAPTVCVPLSGRRQHQPAPSSALDLCGCFRRALLATRRRHGEQVQEHVCRHALYTRAAGLDRGRTGHRGARVGRREVRTSLMCADLRSDERMDPSQARKDTSQARLDSILSYWGKSFKIPRAQNGVATFGRIPNHHASFLLAKVRWFIYGPRANCAQSACVSFPPPHRPLVPLPGLRT